MKPKAIIFSGADPFILDLIEALLAHSCQVFLFTDNPDWWRQMLHHLSQNSSLVINSRGEELPADPAYVFANHRLGFSQRNLKQETDFLTNVPFAKGCFLFSLWFKETISDLAGATAIYLGEVFGPRVTDKEGEVNRLVWQAARQGRVVLPAQDLPLYPLYTKDAVKEILRQIFGFGFEKREFGLAEETTTYAFFNQLQVLKPQLTAEIQAKTPLSKEPKNVEIINPQLTDASALSNTLDWLERTPHLAVAPSSFKQIEIPKSKPAKLNLQRPKFLRKRVPRKKLVLGLIILLWFLFLPFVSVFGTGVFLKLAYQNLLAGRLKTGERLLEASQVVGDLGKKGAVWGARIPILGKAYASTLSVLEIATMAAEAGNRGLTVVDDTQGLLTAVFAEGQGEVDSFAQKLFLELDTLYKDTSFLQSEIQGLPGLVRGFAPDLENLGRLRQGLEGARLLALDLPAILGKERPTTYLVLLQNNMELRPTGGFIGSFALLTFDQGRFADFAIYDVYSADGQLKGHVEPPAPIKDYLGEANWFLRDSNWDPDFPTSAQRAEWFLDKEMDRGVDGVVGLDLEVLKSLLKITGPIYVADYDTWVDENNLYERVQYQVEADFFPGSRKKANFLTALASSVLEKLKTLERKDYAQVAQALWTALESRDIQIFMHQENAANGLSKLGWDGSIVSQSCLRANCQDVWLALNEANLGVNKANYFITRQGQLNLKVEGDFLVSSLELKIKNNAAPALGLSGRYKTYLRLLTNPETRFDDLKIISSRGQENKPLEITVLQGRMEAGALLEVLPGQEMTVRFAWKEPLKLAKNQPGFLNLQVLKQAGVAAYPLGIRVDQGQVLIYNTNLSKDFQQEIPWRNPNSF
jgi:hypothetical protein